MKTRSKPVPKITQKLSTTN